MPKGDDAVCLLEVLEPNEKAGGPVFVGNVFVGVFDDIVVGLPNDITFGALETVLMSLVFGSAKLILLDSGCASLGTGRPRLNILLESATGADEVKLELGNVDVLCGAEIFDGSSSFVNPKLKAGAAELPEPKDGLVAPNENVDVANEPLCVVTFNIEFVAFEVGSFGFADPKLKVGVVELLVDVKDGFAAPKANVGVVNVPMCVVTLNTELLSFEVDCDVWATENAKPPSLGEASVVVVLTAVLFGDVALVGIVNDGVIGAAVTVSFFDCSFSKL